MERRLAGVLIALLSLTLWGSEAVAASAGTVIGVSGPCTDHDRMLNRGDTVQIGDTLDVPAGGNLKLQMEDGSVISVAPDSSITVTGYSIDGSGRDVKLSLKQGVLRANVTSIGRPSKFEVLTAVGTAWVTCEPADWFIKAQPDSVQVGVLAGTVDLTTSTATRQSVSIPAHWGTRLETGLDPVLPRIWAQKEFNGVIHLTQTQH
jgi:hypothetical protein